MRIMALDIGDTRVGVAVSDPGERVASPVAVLPASEVLNCAKPFQRALEDWEPELLLCGGRGGASGRAHSESGENHIRRLRHPLRIR